MLPMHAGLAWPNPGCPVMMVEAEHGLEERAVGSFNARSSNSSSRGAGNATADASPVQGSSYYNRLEAVLAVRHALCSLSKLCSCASSCLRCKPSCTA